MASWVVLKGLVAVQTSRSGPRIPHRYYSAVYAARGAPMDTTRVWIGRRGNLANPGSPGRARLFDSHFMPLTNVARGFPMGPALSEYLGRGGTLGATILQVGHFFALVLHHEWQGLEARPIPGSGAEHCFIPIRPGGARVRWPPPVTVDGLGNPHHITRFFQMRPPEMTRSEEPG